MDGRKPAEGVNVSRRGTEGAEADSALEREIEAALAVQPSPEFVARIRTRIASEPLPAPWWQLRWPVFAGAAAAAGVVIAVALSWQPLAREQVTVRGGTDVLLTIPTREAVNPQRSPAPSTEPRVARAVPRPGPAVARPVSGQRAPEVLISRDEQRGLELLLAAVRDGRLTPTLASQLTARDATVEADIPISEIVIEPLPQIAALGGEDQ